MPFSNANFHWRIRLSALSLPLSPCPDPEPCSLLVAGDMVMVGHAALDRSSAGRGKIFTGNGARLEKADVAPSTLAAPTVTSTPMGT